MSDSLPPSIAAASSRRSFFCNAAGAVSVGAVVTCGFEGRSASAQQAVDDSGARRPLDRATRDALTPDEIIARAVAGNQRFREGRQRRRDPLAELKATVGGQAPAAVMLGCIDSRAPAEVVFDLGMGDLFNCRIAGNIENPDVLGSMEFATKLAGAKVVAVLAHSACGAVQGAIAGAKLGNLTQLLAKIGPAIEQTEYAGERVAENLEFVDAVARKNVELTIGRIRAKSEVISELESSGAIKVIGGFFNLATGEVDFFV